jgi:thiol-disulfide isomerase/thioredoxin
MTEIELRTIIKEEPAVLLYFVSENCRPCEVIREKLHPMMKDFPKIRYIEMPAGTDPALLASFDAFSLPLLLVFFDGREFIRNGLNMSLEELKRDLGRLYDLAFE